MRPRSWLINRNAPEVFREPPTASGKWWQIRADATTAEILLYGEVGWDVTAGQFVNELNSITAPNITVRINSLGGDAYDGITIYNRLVSHHARITAFIDGLAASAATIVMMSGDEIIAEPGASIMVHNAWGMTVGDYRDMKSQMEWLNDLCEQMAGIYAARAGGTVPEWRAIMDAETRYTPEKAQAAGLVDRVNAPKPRPEPASTLDDEELVAMSDPEAVGRLYAGRAAAPSPTPQPAPATAETRPGRADLGPGWAELEADPLVSKMIAELAATRQKQEAAR